MSDRSFMSENSQNPNKMRMPPTLKSWYFSFLDGVDSDMIESVVERRDIWRGLS